MKEMSEDSKKRGVIVDEQCHYGTFQGVANYYPQPQHIVSIPQPVPPDGATNHPRYPHGYQTITTGYAVYEARPMREDRLPCCGLGMGWFLFLVGFFLGGFPWYVGAFILLCVRVDYREKPGYVACLIASVLAMIAVILGVRNGTHAWRGQITT